MFEFLEPIELTTLTTNEAFENGQYGHEFLVNTNGSVDWESADIVLVGINEYRGLGIGVKNSKEATAAIRKQLYALYQWHKHIRIADVGDVKLGATTSDSYSAIAIVIKELITAGKRVVCVGGAHDTSLGIYYAFQQLQQQIEVTCIDSLIDLSLESYKRSENFLLEMLTHDNNYVRHYNHLGFQSYMAHPKMMETLDSLRFDCHRLGKLRQQMSLYEPIIRNSHFLSFDINTIQPSFMPCHSLSPNGLAGEEACLLTRYAGFSNTMQVMSIHNYTTQHDDRALGALQVAQMIWYFIDGYSKLLGEKELGHQEAYNEFHALIHEESITFYQNKENSKWWMQLPDQRIVACAYEDYLMASHNEIPETWLRYQERLV